MLSDAQKAQIRLYLGYPDYFRYKHTRLESVLDNLSPDAETLIGTALTTLVTIQTSLLAASTTQAGVKRVDEIWFDNSFKRPATIRSIGRMYVGQISIITGVPIYSDVFGTGGYLGDSFSGSGGGARLGNGSFFGLG